MGQFLDTVPFSGIIRIRDMMYGVKDPFRLDQGDVSFDAPETVKAAMHRAIDENRSHYLQTTGLPRLLELLAEKLQRRNGIPIGGPDEVMVTTGGIHGLFIACQALLEPGDEVIVPDPEWPPCMGNIKAARGVPVPCPLHERLSWRYDLDELASKITSKTRAIYINSPHNPTGGVLTRTDLQAITEVADRHGIWLFSDEAYEDVVFDGEHIPLATIAPERTLTISSIGKTFSVTGWKTGWATGPAPLRTCAARATSSHWAASVRRSRGASAATVGSSGRNVHHNYVRPLRPSASVRRVGRDDALGGDRRGGIRAEPRTLGDDGGRGRGAGRWPDSDSGCLCRPGYPPRYKADDCWHRGTCEQPDQFASNYSYNSSD